MADARVNVRNVTLMRFHGGLQCGRWLAGRSCRQLSECCELHGEKIRNDQFSIRTTEVLLTWFHWVFSDASNLGESCKNSG